VIDYDSHRIILKRRIELPSAMRPPLSERRLKIIIPLCREAQDFSFAASHFTIYSGTHPSQRIF
jgi:hypothetical protein